jgi:RanBP-type and C3HC4-type zinc finger-containing protein 1
LFRVCLLNLINNCTNVTEIKCPSESCDNILNSPEISFILKTKSDATTRFRLRMQQHREITAANRFHCGTRNCPGYKSDENNKDTQQQQQQKHDNITDPQNQFYCNICEKINCMKCKRVFNSKNKHECIIDISKQTEQATDDANIKPLIDQGILMRCPRCRIFLEKEDSGCQFIRCYYCKTDICWLTKLPRWGPAVII